MPSETYNLLNRAWKSTSRIVFGQEIGELTDYSEWLADMADPVFTAKSSISGKEVTFASDQYPKGSKRMGFEEVDFSKRAEPLGMNEIKDIDSLVDAVSERICYTGNMVLGNSKFVEKSSNVSDSYYVYGSSEIGDSKYIAFSSMARLCEYSFGCAAPGESTHTIRCNDTYRSRRCFEFWMSANCTDCYYVFNLNNCSDCFFSFNLRSARHAIGNVKLERLKYLEIKKRLLEQMVGELKDKKKLPSLLDIVKKSDYEPEEAKAAVAGHLSASDGEKTSLTPIDEAFSRASRVLFGTELPGLETYSKWLTKRIQQGEPRKSVLSGRGLFVGNYANYLAVPKERTVTEEDALKLVERSKSQEGIERILLENAHEFVGKIAYIALDFHDGTNRNVIDCMSYAYSSDAYRCAPCVQIKYSAYNFWPRSSEHIFGNGVLFDSSFCIHCYQSIKLSRCFEVDSSRDCSDCYFCHNCENVRDSMFCFNVKNLKYAVGNVEVGKEEFARLKKLVLEKIVAELAAKKDLKLDIYNIGSHRG